MVDCVREGEKVSATGSSEVEGVERERERKEGTYTAAAFFFSPFFPSATPSSFFTPPLALPPNVILPPLTPALTSPDPAFFSSFFTPAADEAGAGEAPITPGAWRFMNLRPRVPFEREVLGTRGAMVVLEGGLREGGSRGR